MINIKLRTLISVFLIFTSSSLWSQNEYKIFKFKIRSSIDRSALKNVTIKTSTGTQRISDTNGEVDLMLKASDQHITFHYLGYRTDTTLVQNLSDRINEIILRPIDNMMEEVVIHTGYQNIGKERLTGSVYQLDHNVLNSMVSTSIIDRLANNVPGLVLNKTGGNPTNQTQLSIRGQSTIFSRPDPLIVLDNFPYDGDLSSINPDDIESVTVLKDAAAASVWGARAANGVIILTSKTRTKGKDVNVSINNQMTITGKPNLFYQPRISSSDFIKIERTLFENGFYKTQESSTNKPVLTPVIEMLIANRDGNLTGIEIEQNLEDLGKIDLREQMERYYYQSAKNQHYALNLSNVVNNTSWMTSLGYDYNIDNLVNNSYKRLNGRLLLNQVFWKDRLSVTTNLMMNSSDASIANTGNLTMTSSKSIYPYAQLRNPDGSSSIVYKDYRYSYLKNLMSQDLGLLDWYYRPLDELELGDKHKKDKEYRMDFNAKVKIIQGLSLESFYQYVNRVVDNKDNKYSSSYEVRNLINQYTDTLTEGRLFRPIPLGNILDANQQQVETNRIRMQAVLSKQLSTAIDIQSIAGFEINKTNSKGIQNRFYGYNPDRSSIQTVDYANSYNSFLNPATANLIPFRDDTFKLADRFISYYQNTSLSIAKKYIITASTRFDQSNIFGVRTNQKGVPLWSVGLAWVLNNEEFFKISNMSQFKIRATYGYNGNVNRSLSAYTTASYSSVAAYTKLPFATIVNPPNEELKWERTRVINSGVDFGFFDDRITGTFDLYLKKGFDLIGDAPYPASSGITKFRGNVASSKGSGFEFVLNGLLLKRTLQWNATLMVSRATDIVTDYMDLPISGLNLIQGSSINPQVGKPLYAMYSFQSKGLDPVTGDPLAMLAGELSSDWNAIVQKTKADELNYFGSTRPIMNSSFRNTFVWKRLSLSTNISYRGNYFYRRSSIRYMDNGLLDMGLASSHADYYLRWTAPGDELYSTVPSIPTVANSNRDNVYIYGQSLVKRADHIRWENLSISYDLPYKGIGFKSMECSFFLNNIGVIWKKTKHDLDPDFVGLGQLAPSRSYSIAVRLTL